MREKCKELLKQINNPLRNGSRMRTQLPYKAYRRAALGGVNGEALWRRDGTDRNGAVPRGRPHLGADLQQPGDLLGVRGNYRHDLTRNRHNRHNQHGTKQLLRVPVGTEQNALCLRGPEGGAGITEKSRHRWLLWLTERQSRARTGRRGGTRVDAGGARVM